MPLSFSSASPTNRWPRNTVRPLRERPGRPARNRSRARRPAHPPPGRCCRLSVLSNVEQYLKKNCGHPAAQPGEGGETCRTAWAGATVRDFSATTTASASGTGCPRGQADSCTQRMPRPTSIAARSVAPVKSSAMQPSSGHVTPPMPRRNRPACISQPGRVRPPPATRRRPCCAAVPFEDQPAQRFDKRHMSPGARDAGFRGHESAELAPPVVTATGTPRRRASATACRIALVMRGKREQVRPRSHGGRATVVGVGRHSVRGASPSVSIGEAPAHRRIGRVAFGSPTIVDRPVQVRQPGQRAKQPS